MGKMSQALANIVVAPLTIAILGAIASFFVPQTVIAAEASGALKEVLAAIINLGAIAVGFLMTAKSILYTAANSERMKHFRDSSEFRTMLTHFSVTVLWLFGLVLTSTLFLAVNGVVTVPWVVRTVFILWGGSLAGAAVATVWAFVFYERALGLDAHEETAQEKEARAKRAREEFKRETIEQLRDDLKDLTPAPAPELELLDAVPPPKPLNDPIAEEPQEDP